MKTMYGYHLWILLRETVQESDCGSLAARLDELKARVKARLQPIPDNPVLQVNGEHLFQCSESHNHQGDVHARLLEILHWLAAELPGSYGLVYWYDDETPGRQAFDGYRVIRIARGSLEHRYDPFLSPVAPVVEE